MKILHKNGYSISESKEFIETIHENIISSICSIIIAMPDLGISFADETNKVNNFLIG